MWFLFGQSVVISTKKTTSTPQLPFKRPQIPTNKDHMTLIRATLGGAGSHNQKGRLLESPGNDRTSGPTKNTGDTTTNRSYAEFRCRALGGLLGVPFGGMAP